MSPSSLSWRWVVESLANNPDANTSLLSALVDRFPVVLADSSGAVQERLALRYLEECSGMACGETPPPPLASDGPSTSASAAGIDAALTCEEVLRSKVTVSNDRGKEKAGILGGDLHQFILLKRATLPKSSIELLKDRLLGSHCSNFLHSKEHNRFLRVSRPYGVNHLTYNSCREHHSMKKITESMKIGSPLKNKLKIFREYRKLKNLPNTPLGSDGGALPKVSSCSLVQTSPNDDKRCQQTLQNAADDDRRNQQTSTDGIGNEIHLLKDNLLDNAPVLDSVPDNFNGCPQSEQQSQKQNVLHDDRAGLHGEVYDSICDDVQLLEQSNMPQPSFAQSLCIKCGISGQLLNCCGDGCSIAIHESCLGQSASADKSGQFYCPFCDYRNALMIYQKSKREAHEARRNLFSFYDIGQAVHILKRKQSLPKFMVESDQVRFIQKRSEHADLPSNQQLKNSSIEKKRDVTQNSETDHSRFTVDNSQDFTKEQKNQLNSAADIVYKNSFSSREASDTRIHQDVQSTHVTLKSGSGREHECTRVTENRQPVEDHEISDNVSLPCELNASHKGIGNVRGNSSGNGVCRDQLKIEQRKNLHANDADHRIRSNVSLLCEVNTSYTRISDVCGNNGGGNVCSDHLQTEQRKKGHADDADHRRLTLGANEGLKVGGEFDHNAKRKACDSRFSDMLQANKRSALPIEQRKTVHVDDADQEQLSLRSNKISSLLVEGDCDCNAKRKALASQIGYRFARRNKKDTTAAKTCRGAVENQQTDNSFHVKDRKCKYLHKQCSILKEPSIRRLKLLWTSEEEEVLEEAVEQIPKNDDGSIPWTKILEYGHHVLHKSRTPIDLKDKWRNMQRKEAKNRG